MKNYTDTLLYVDEYSKSINAATGSKFDSNANVENKNVVTLAGEIPKGDFIGLNRAAMGRKIEALYGNELAEEYIRQLKDHEIYTHDESGFYGMPYCVAITLYPFLYDGLKKIGGTSGVPSHVGSFAGALVNLLYAIGAQFKGAIAVPEAIMYLDYFIRKEYGDDYFLYSDDIVNNRSSRKTTIRKEITDVFEQIVYALNEAAGARNFQSIFCNFAYYDKPYFEGMFGDFYFPDGTKPQWESLSWLQKTFMKWFNKERLRNPLTFPVETMSMLYTDGEFVDEEWADFTAEMYGEGHSFFTYISDSVDSLSSCCFSGEQKVLTKSSNGIFYGPIREVLDGKYSDYRKNFTVFHNGSWVSAKPVRLPSRKMYKLITSNKKEIIVTDNHLNLTTRGDVATSDLTTEDYLAFNTRALDSFPEKDSHLTYAQGFLVGAYAGDGSHNRGADRSRKNFQIILSLNQENREDLEILNKGLLDLGIEKEWKTYDEGKLMTTVCSSETLYDFIYSFVDGGYAIDKKFRMNCLYESKAFRQGILDGWYRTDGGNSNRIYSISKDLIETGEVILTSLGVNSTISMDDTRVDEVAFIEDGKEYKHNYPLYCLRWYDMKNKRTMGGIYKVINNTEYFKITSIEEVEYDSDTVYCFEIDPKKEPYFTLPNGIITHNCRLRNEISENTFSFTLGAGGVATGSKMVITMNINRLVQNAVRDGRDIGEAVRLQTDKIHKYLYAYNEILRDFFRAKMLPVYDAGFISLDKQYLTLGINGFIEGAEFLGIEISDNQDYRSYSEMILRPIYELNKAHKTKDVMYNTEFVPRMSGDVKPFLIDLEVSSRRQGASVIAA